MCQLIASTTELPSATRPQVFRELAARPDLRSHDQVYLTNALMAEGRGRDSASILVVLAANRALTPVGRRHLLSAMDGLASAYDRARVMQALNDNR